DYCDPLVEDESYWAKLIEPLLLVQAPIRFRCLRNDIPSRDSRFRLCNKAIWHGIDLTADESTLWGGLSGQARQNMRHANRSGVVVRAGKKHVAPPRVRTIMKPPIDALA